MSTRYHPTSLTDGCWSPTRPAVFCTGKDDGTVDFWDFIFKQNDPSLTRQVQNALLNIYVNTLGFQRTDHNR